MYFLVKCIFFLIYFCRFCKHLTTSRLESFQITIPSSSSVQPKYKIVKKWHQSDYRLQRALGLNISWFSIYKKIAVKFGAHDAFLEIFGDWLLKDMSPECLRTVCHKMLLYQQKSNKHFVMTFCMCTPCMPYRYKTCCSSSYKVDQSVSCNAMLYLKYFAIKM